MELDFGITEYYKRRYGTEKEIDDFCAAICIIAKRKVYSSKIDRIDFLPFILPEELIQQGMGPVYTKIELRYRLVTRDYCSRANLKTSPPEAQRSSK